MSTIFRKWLEPVTGDNTCSFAKVEADKDSWGQNKKYRDVSLSIGACYKVITLEFDAVTGRKKSLKKLAVLQEALDTVKAELEKEA